MSVGRRAVKGERKEEAGKEKRDGESNEHAMADRRV
jgi:hypothetical protein